MKLKKEKTKIIYCLPHSTHYHTYLIDKVIDNDQYDLKVIYFQDILKGYPWKNNNNTKAPFQYLNKSFLNIDWKFISNIDSNAVYFIAGWNEPTMILLLFKLFFIKRKYVILTDTISNKKRFILKKIFRHVWVNYFVLRNAYAILTTGVNGVSLISNLPIGNKVTVFNFPFVTDLDFFKPKLYDKSSDEFIFLSSGRIDLAHKGYHIAIEALRLLKKNQPLFRFKYVILGTGPDQEELQRLLFEKKLQDNVDILGWKEISELPYYYSIANIFLHPSFFDPYPNAILEAMACGKIVIASNLAGSATDRIIHKSNGFIFKAGDPIDLYNNIKFVLGLNQSNLSKIENSARTTAEKWSYLYNFSVLDDLNL
jgi:glycosyltransferase involved in cell wall biosynthesis